MKETSIERLFKEMGYDTVTMPIDEPIAISGFSIKSYNPETKSVEYKKVKHICKKSLTELYLVEVGDNKLRCSGDHKIAISDTDGNITYVHALALEGKPAISIDGQTINVSRLGTSGYVYDIEVEGNHNYFSNNILSHNSMYGLDKDTTGGNQWKYAPSIRIRMKRGKKIEQKTAVGKRVVGIHGSLVVEKSRLGPPFATSEFDIYFKNGIDASSGLFDVLVGDEVILPRVNEEGKIAKGWWTYKDSNFRQSELPKILNQYPELLGGHTQIEVPENTEVVEGEEEDDSASDADM